jgi:hypothetical protein
MTGAVSPLPIADLEASNRAARSERAGRYCRRGSWGELKTRKARAAGTAARITTATTVVKSARMSGQSRLSGRRGYFLCFFFTHLPFFSFWPFLQCFLVGVGVAGVVTVKAWLVVLAGLSSAS